jgi:hypothetical protein
MARPRAAQRHPMPQARLRIDRRSDRPPGIAAPPQPQPGNRGIPGRQERSNVNTEQPICALRPSRTRAAIGVQADIVTESGASRVSPLPGRVWPLTAWAWPRACTIVHQDVRPSGHSVPDIPAAPAAPALTSVRWPDTLRGHPAEQQPGQPPHRSGRTHTPGACRASPPRHSEQAVPLAGLLRLVLHGLGEVLVVGHGLPPRQRLPAGLAAGFGSHIAGAGKAALRYIRSRTSPNHEAGA